MTKDGRHAAGQHRKGQARPFPKIQKGAAPAPAPKGTVYGAKKSGVIGRLFGRN